MRCKIVIALAVLAACQPVPKPFSHEGAPPGDLLKLPDGPGITVLPIMNAAGEPMKHLTTPMVEALQRQNIPAAYDQGNRESFLLTGDVRTPPAPPGLIWTLKTQAGRDIGQVVQTLPSVPGQLPLLDKRAPFEQAAAKLAALIQDSSAAESKAPPVYVAEVAGAPGDGNTRLRAAIEQLLLRAGLKLVPASDVESLVVVGTVDIGPPARGEQTVEIAWTVLDPFGTEVGTIAQARPVAAGSLDKSWGLIANEAAIAGATGIAELIGKIDWSQGFRPPSDDDRAATSF